MTGQSEMTTVFVIFPDFFEIERQKQEEDLHEFVRDVFPDLHSQLKYLTFGSIHFFNCDYFIANFTQVLFHFFCLIYESPREYHLTISSESYMGCD